jgi:hypothetical protein
MAQFFLIYFASFEDFNTPMDYYTKKTDALFNFGVE